MSQTGGMRLFPRRLGEASAPWGDCGPYTGFASYTLALELQLKEISENLIQVNRKAVG